MQNKNVNFNAKILAMIWKKKENQFLLKGMIYLPIYDDSLRIQLEGSAV